MKLIKATQSALRRFTACERGTQFVELAIVLPILLLLFATTAEFGRFFYTYTTLTKATRSAARYLVTTPNKTGADAGAQNLVVYGNTEGTGNPIVGGLSTNNVQIVREGTVNGFPEKVTVVIDGYIYQPIFDLGKFVGNRSVSLNVEIKPSTTMRLMQF